MFVKPVTLNCGHTFCKYCLLNYFLKRNLDCGICRNDCVSEHPLDLKINVVINTICRQLNPRQYLQTLKLQSEDMEQSDLHRKLLEKYPIFQDIDNRAYSQRYRAMRRTASLTRLERLYDKIMSFIEFLKPYVRVTRVIVTYIAPLVMMILYMTHSKMRTKKIWQFIRNFKSDRTFVSSGALQS
jgi:hypothetical protein